MRRLSIDKFHHRGFALLESSLLLAAVLPVLYAALCFVVYLNKRQQLQQIVSAYTHEVEFRMLRVNSGDQDFFVGLRPTERAVGRGTDESREIAQEIATFTKDGEKAVTLLKERFLTSGICEGCNPTSYRVSLVAFGFRVEERTGVLNLQEPYVGRYLDDDTSLGTLSKLPQGIPSIQTSLFARLERERATGEPSVFALASALLGSQRGQFYGNWTSTILHSTESITTGSADWDRRKYLEYTGILGAEIAYDVGDTWYGKTLSVFMGDTLPEVLHERVIFQPRVLF
jgi:hypothetical protein